MTGWRSLTKQQQETLGNGCGAKGGLVSPPNFCFEASCDQHDYYYWRGWTEEHRMKADKAFLAAMLRDARRSPWYARPMHKVLAWTYYRAVRKFGAAHFHYANEMRTDDPGQ
ncbi:MAG: hypothetical protein ACI88C_000084 [Acidimicrobiales bacterium]|jgi:hypothetical protein